MAIPNFPHTHMKFRSWSSLLPPPFVIYADIETKTIPVNESDQGDKNTKRINELVPFMIGYFIKFSQAEIFDKHPSLKQFEYVQLFEGSNCIEDCFLKLKKDCYEIKTIVRSPQPLQWTPQLEHKFRSETICGICKRPYNPHHNTQSNWMKVRHHDHITGDYICSAHQLCNLRYETPTTQPTNGESINRRVLRVILSYLETLKSYRELSKLRLEPP